ncbi:DUF2690 domain-containing protein [Streptomyces sp. WAC01280]|uniref:DUF2690 domain-containing protein n=1 Tax=Streptomyces sp. WAC01280 TaxID=2487424 RepID=UPI000F766A1E|nr:DUF2690 domain-containing protein [Streptomyces sp. WAC01280]RSS55344.1 DUF2690 domain-containing protein [Streptomyces sp. WAC01280]
MNALTRKLATVGSALAMAASSLLLASSPASAATSCYASSCEGLDPATTICQNDARTVQTSSRFGVQLRYSPTCRAAWARVDGYSDAPMAVVVENSRGATYRTYTTGGTEWTRMVNDKDILARAYGFKEEGAQYAYSPWY